MKGRVQSGTALRAELITAACTATGHTAEAVSAVIEPVVKYLQDNYGGGKLYIAKPGRMLDLQQLYADYIKRVPERELCRKHSISPRTLVRIIDEAVDSGMIATHRTLRAQK